MLGCLNFKFVQICNSEAPQLVTVTSDRVCHLATCMLVQLCYRLVKHAYPNQLLEALTTLKLCLCTSRFSLCHDVAKLSDVRTVPQEGAQSLLELDACQDL